MILTPAQVDRHWAEYAAVCREHGWKTTDSMRRKAFYKTAGIVNADGSAKSLTEFSRVEDFDKFLKHARDLQGKVDIEYRDRFRLETAVQRMDEALRALTGRDYAKAITRDMADIEDWRNLPIDERPSIADLGNLRDTLHNRLSAAITKLKKGQLAAPASLAWILDGEIANNPAIEAIVAGKLAIRRQRGRTVWYEQVTRAQYDAMQAQRRRAAAVLHGDHFADASNMAEAEAFALTSEPAPRGKGRPLMAASMNLGNVADLTDDDIPF